MDDLHKFLGTFNFKFPITDLHEHQIDTNTPINNIDLPGNSFYHDKTKSSQSGTGLFLSHIKFCLYCYG